ncbi:MAG: right-handed parallel beta-helix repeat-containing protein, partial [Isosphaeraceae bacterium]|nr:right-handed parallel beta-helix repeat-containing protein [Isosphaeraceae bacterium]
LLHINSNDALVEGNQVLNNGDDGISLFDSHRNTIRNNMIQGNRSGIRLRVGSSDNVISGNEIGSSLTYGVYLYQGSDPPTSGDGRPRRNTFIGNIIHDSGSDAIKLTDADDNTFSGNIFANNDSIVFQRGLGNRFTANTLPSTAVLFTLGDLTFASITYISDQASIAVQVDRYSTIVFDDTGGRVFDLGSPGKATTITPSGSALMLGQADIGTIPSLITTRDFRITITDQSVLVRPVTWQTSGDLIKEWTTQAAFATQGVTYTVGDLAADTTYMVEKNGATLMILTSDASGHVSFDDIAGTTDLVAYTMQPITS